MMKRVLVVEDSQSMRMLVNFVLRSKGCEVVQAENGQDGLARLDDKTFDLIITDLNMPVMDGLRFIRELKKLDAHKSAPIIILTTEGNNEMKDQALEAGANEHVQKPFDKQAFLGIVENLLAT